jgi:phosphoribosylanthranilate isomerase
MKLKICGMKYASNINEVAALKPDFMGFIFYPASARFVGSNFDPQLLKSLPEDIKKTGVFVNAALADILVVINAYKLDYVQLHGNESPVQCKALNRHAKVIKAFGIHPGFDFNQTEAYEDSCEYLLFDTQSQTHGGTGKSFDYALLQNYRGKVQFFLSGGIGLEEIAGLDQIVHPMLAGIDVNSRFETAPGMKDIQALGKIKFEKK